MTGISLDTLALTEAWAAVAGRFARQDARVNGSAWPPPHWQQAIAELRAAAMVAHPVGSAAATKVDTPAEAPSRFEEVGVAEAAQRLGVTAQAIRKRIKAGRLPARKASGVWLIKLEDTRATSQS